MEKGFRFCADEGRRKMEIGYLYIYPAIGGVFLSVYWLLLLAKTGLSEMRGGAWSAWLKENGARVAARSLGLFFLWLPLSVYLLFKWISSIEINDVVKPVTMPSQDRTFPDHLANEPPPGWMESE